MKRKYNRPAMRAIALRQQQHLLSGSSGINGEIPGYRKSSSGFSQDEEDEPLRKTTTHTMNKRRHYLWAMLGSMILVGLTACSGDDDQTDKPDDGVKSKEKTGLMI